MGKKSVKTTNAPPSYIQDAQKQVLGQAQNVAATPYQQYGGNLVAGFTPDQLSAFNTINNAQGVGNQFLPQALGYTQNSTNPFGNIAGDANNISGAINAFQNPFTQNVVNSTLASINNQNAQQQNQLVGNAVASGAWGGDRAAVAQGVLGGQQALAADQTISNLYNQGYQTSANQALQAASQSGLLNLYAGNQLAGLGSTAQQNILSGANAQLGAGAQQQNLAQQQLNVPYQQWLQQQQYPFQTTQWLSGILNGITPGAGSTTTQPAPSFLSQIGGLGLSLAGLGAFSSNTNLPLGGVFRDGGPVDGEYAGGGGLPLGVNHPIMGTPMGMMPPGGPRNFDGFASDTPLLPAYDAGGPITDMLPEGLPLGTYVPASSPAASGSLHAPHPIDTSVSPASLGVDLKSLAMGVPGASDGSSGSNAPSVLDMIKKDPHSFMTMAGLAMMSGNSPFALQNIGQGALSALNAVSNERREDIETDRWNKEFGLKQADLDRASKQLDAEIARWNKESEQAGINEKDLQAYRSGELGMRKGELGLENARLGLEGAGTWALVGTTPDGFGIYKNNRTMQTTIDKSTPIVGVMKPSGYTKITPDAALRQANADWNGFVKQDKDNGGSGTVYNLDGTTAKKADWIKARQSGYTNGNLNVPVATPGAPAPAAPPGGVDQNVALQQARAALAAGAPRAAVVQRLISAGVDPSGL